MKLLIYPMNKSLAPLGRYGSMLAGYDQVIPVAPRSFGYGTGDMALVDGGMECGVKLTYDLESALVECDAIFVDCCNAMNVTEQQYIGIIRRSIDMGKRVFISDDLHKLLANHCGDEICRLSVEVLGYNEKNITLNEENRLLDLPVPCILVFGAGDLTNKFDIQLGLRKVFQESGYTVMQLGTKKFSSFFGFDPLPKFLFEPGDSRRKVLNFNHYVYEKAKAEDADVVIIGVPGGIMPNNPYEFTEFGETAFLIGSALKADAAILSLYSAPYLNDTLHYLLNICKYRFNSPTRYVNLACYDMMVSAETLEFQTLSIPVNRVKNNILPEIVCPGIEVFAAMDTEAMSRIGEQIMDEFGANI